MTAAARILGGLAVVAGLGVAVATAMAEPAMAAPGRPSDDARQADRGPRAASVQRPTARQTAPKPAAARANGSRPRASAAIADPPVSAVTGAAAPQTVRGRAARGAAQRREPIPDVPAAVTMQDIPGRLITIYKGTHFAIPNRWALWVQKVSGDATFIPDSTYDLGDEDQYDWNKLAGITYTPWRPERDASIVVWRYNLKNGMFEVGPFFDVNFGYVFPTAQEVLTVPAGETFTYSVDYSGITVSYGDTTVFKPTPVDLVPNFWTSARITGWFGGSEVAPRTVSYYLTMV